MIAYPLGTGTPWQIIKVPSGEADAAWAGTFLVGRLPVFRPAVWAEMIETNNAVTLRIETTTRSR
jgi:hypothetical protein